MHRFILTLTEADDGRRAHGQRLLELELTFDDVRSEEQNKRLFAPKFLRLVDPADCETLKQAITGTIETEVKQARCRHERQEKTGSSPNGSFSVNWFECLDCGKTWNDD